MNTIEKIAQSAKDIVQWMTYDTNDYVRTIKIRTKDEVVIPNKMECSFIAKHDERTEFDRWIRETIDAIVDEVSSHQFNTATAATRTFRLLMDQYLGNYGGNHSFFEPGRSLTGENNDRAVLTYRFEFRFEF